MISKPRFLKWWIFAIIAFLIFVLLQIPAAWLISRFYKNNQTLQNVSGNIWQGQADWQRGQLKGTLAWKTRPLDLILLRAGADVEVHSGNTQLQGTVAYGAGKKLIIKSMTGQIAAETLKTLADWQWPTNPVQLKDLSFNFKKGQGFSQADGQLLWGGGELIYTYAQRQEQMNVPSLKGALTEDNNKLIFDIRDQRDQKMVNLTLDQEMMTDVQLTQRFLMNIASYNGKAGLDTYVISTRQPLLRGGIQ
ncbi:type II secretion system protein N [Acinetobacter chinensis]|jgi:general secretion pathway protein N|uniref:type II secretion system protein N n=1 Tax=Acinetobacter chinensis TaxID=2004650 RepID=UPI002934BA82|nr:type II secretion system protein N [Acinetobacter chinensis]WOE41833.1 type II secretion system protein N [Acinetobacter chinensis]